MLYLKICVIVALWI